MESANLHIEELIIDARKADYISTKYRVSPADVFEVLHTAPKFTHFDRRWGIFDMIGPNRAGRFLVAGIQQVEGTTWRLVTAYWNTDGRAQKDCERLR